MYPKLEVDDWIHYTSLETAQTQRDAPVVAAAERAARVVAESPPHQVSNQSPNQSASRGSNETDSRSASCRESTVESPDSYSTNNNTRPTKVDAQPNTLLADMVADNQEAVRQCDLLVMKLSPTANETHGDDLRELDFRLSASRTRHATEASADKGFSLAVSCCLLFSLSLTLAVSDFRCVFQSLTLAVSDSRCLFHSLSLTLVVSFTR